VTRLFSGLLLLAFLLPGVARAEVPEIRTVWGNAYEFPKPPEGELSEGLDPESAPMFHRNRERILKSAATFLDTVRPIVYAYGKVAPPIGFVLDQIKRPIAFTLHHTVKRPALYAASFLPERPWNQWLKAQPNLGVDTEFEPPAPANQTTKDWVQTTLKQIDESLWMNTKVVTGAHEFGLAFEGGASAGGKAMNRGLYGIAGVGITFLVDPGKRAFIVEVFLDMESVRQAVPGYVGAGLFGTITGNAQIYDWNKPLKATCGQAVCVPGLVGSVTEDSLRAGVSKEAGAGFPGVAVFASDALRVPLARVGVSPQFPLLVKTRTILGAACAAGFNKLVGRASE